MDDADIVKRLRNYNTCSDTDVDEAADEIERLRKERDEARVQVCLLSAHIKHGNKYPLSKAMEVAEKLGWDCFEENTR